jgi:hypothetical protein
MVGSMTTVRSIPRPMSGQLGGGAPRLERGFENPLEWSFVARGRREICPRQASQNEFIQAFQARGFENGKTDSSPFGAYEDSNHRPAFLAVSCGLGSLRDARIQF